MATEPTVVEPATRPRKKNPRKRNVVVGYSGKTRLMRPDGYKKRKNAFDKIKILDRRRRAYNLRIAGHTAEVIGRTLHADPSMNVSGEGTDMGYGWQNYIQGKPPVIGDALRMAVHRDLTEGFRAAAKYEQYGREEYVRLETEALDVAQAAIMPKVRKGDARAVEQLVNISARRAKLRGLDIDRVESEVNLNLTVEGKQPDYRDPEFTASFQDGLQALGVPLVLPPSSRTEDDDVIDAVVVEPEAVNEPVEVAG